MHSKFIPNKIFFVLQVEMISWEAEDISPTRDGGIRREILEEGASFSTPKDGANVESKCFLQELSGQ